MHRWHQLIVITQAVREGRREGEREGGRDARSGKGVQRPSAVGEHFGAAGGPVLCDTVIGLQGLSPLFLPGRSIETLRVSIYRADDPFPVGT